MTTRLDPEPQGELLPVEHEGLHPSRVRSRVSEGVYAKRWKKHAASNLSSGGTLLDHILWPEKSQSVWRFPPQASRRDAVVAATVVQWLGTACGHSFVVGCEREIHEADDQQMEWSIRWWKSRDGPLAFTKQAEILAAPFVGLPGHADLVRNAAAAMHAAATAWFERVVADPRPMERGIVLPREGE